MITNVNLFYQDHGSDKVYNVSLVETNGLYKVNFSYGRRGSTLNVGSKTPYPTDLSIAKSIFDKLVGEKVAKGYREIRQTTVTASVVNAIDSRDIVLRPQLLNECSKEDVAKYIADNNWCAQEKFDGENRMLIKSGDKVIGANKKGLTIPLPFEIENSVAQLSGDFVINGEAFSNIIQCFDLVEPILPYKQRYKSLVEICKDSDAHLTVVKTAWNTQEKQDLYLELLARNAEGIVFKNIHAKYIPGRPSSGGDQLKFKFYETASCIVTGINTGKRSIQISLYNEKGELVDVGNATIYPNQDVPELNSIVEIKYLYAYPGGSLYQPIFLKPRHDVDASECLCSKLKWKPVTN
jgi:bifunctional non-homologous end joining protein LigD